MSHNVVESRSSMFACFDVKRHKQLVSDHLIQVKVKQISFFQPSSDDDASQYCSLTGNRFRVERIVWHEKGKHRENESTPSED